MSGRIGGYDARHPDNHILPKAKMVEIGSGAKREMQDYWVTRWGAYLITMNGNPRFTMGMAGIEAAKEVGYPKSQL